MTAMDPHELVRHAPFQFTSGPLRGKPCDRAGKWREVYQCQSYDSAPVELKEQFLHWVRDPQPRPADAVLQEPDRLWEAWLQSWQWTYR